MRTVLKVTCILFAALVLVIRFAGPSSELESIRRDASLIIKSEKDLRQEQLEAWIDSFVDANPKENLRLVHRDRKFAVYAIVR